jgi:hypothetical protein
LVNIEVTILRVNIHPEDDSSQYQANHHANDGGSRHL